MFGFDDAAKMGLGAINSGVQIYGQLQQGRMQGKLNDLQYEQALRHYNEKISDLKRGQEDVNRQAYYGQNDARQAIGDQQGPGSSYAKYMYGRQEGERSRRYDALQRDQDRETADWLDWQKQFEIQQKMAKSQATMGMISSLLMQGGSAAGSAFGGMAATNAAQGRY